MSERFEVRFSAEADPGSPEYALLSYLKDPTKVSRHRLKDMTMIALTNMWLPLAYRDDEQLTPQQFHRVVCDCTHRLMLQVQYLREMDELTAQPPVEPEADEEVGQLVEAPDGDNQVLPGTVHYDYSSAPTEARHGTQSFTRFRSTVQPKLSLPEENFDPEEMFNEVK